VGDLDDDPNENEEVVESLADFDDVASKAKDEKDEG